MTVSRVRILVPILLLLIVTAIAVGLLVGGGDDVADESDDAPSPPVSTDASAESDSPAEPNAPTEPGDPSQEPPAAPLPDTTESPAPEAPDLARRMEGDPMAAGPVDAPVSVVVFSDYGCPYCQRWAHDTQPTILEYAARGDVRLEWRDVGILGEDSVRAATAAAAAAQQGMFWQFHDALFAQMDARSVEQLTALAGEIGLDVEQFAQDLTGPAAVSIVQANIQEGRSLGVQSTPSFMVAGTPVVGAQPTEVFVELIDAALAGQL